MQYYLFENRFIENQKKNTKIQNLSYNIYDLLVIIISIDFYRVRLAVRFRCVDVVYIYIYISTFKTRSPESRRGFDTNSDRIPDLPDPGVEG